MIRIVGVSAVLAVSLAACGKPAAPVEAPPPPPSAPPAAATAGGPVNADPHVTTYACAGGEAVTAGYPDSQTAIVDYRGHAYTLKIARSGSGARYTGMGLQWWTKGVDHGSLAQLKPGEDIASAPGIDCASQAVPDAEPPAPGTPGGLPDDRTPISEAPFTPTSAQGAANVVQTYFALLETGKAQEAAALRSDGAVVDLKPYATYHGQVGAPGPIEGAAGSLYVEAPVVLYGRKAQGGEFHQSGKVVLRRVNNVPGATAAQLRWRIERFDLTAQ